MSETYYYNDEKILKMKRVDILKVMKDMSRHYINKQNQLYGEIAQGAENVRLIKKEIEKEREWIQGCSDYNYIKDLMDRCQRLEQEKKVLLDDIDNYRDNTHFKGQMGYIKQLEANIVARELKR